MKLMRFKEPQILSILRQTEGGIPVAELCREHGVSNASLYKWRAKYGGMDASMIADGQSRQSVTAIFKVNILTLRQAMNSTLYEL